MHLIIVLQFYSECAIKHLKILISSVAFCNVRLARFRKQVFLTNNLISNMFLTLFVPTLEFFHVKLGKAILYVHSDTLSSQVTSSAT